MVLTEVLIIYSSIHHQNTKKIAIAMGEVLNAKTVKTTDVKPEDLSKFDLIGFGSGIYAMRADDGLLHLIENLPQMTGKKAFVFTTSGMGIAFSGSLAKTLRKKEFDVIGKFDCRGFVDWGPFRLVRGVNKGKPDDSDIAMAKEFAKELIRKFTKP